MKDPFYHNEKLRYDSPIPSREFIIELLKKNKKPINFETLTKRLNLTTEKHICAVKKRIKAMIRDGQIFENRKGCLVITQQMDLCHGIVQFSKDKQALLWLVDQNKKVPIIGIQSAELMQGDEIIARYTSHEQVVVVEVVARTMKKIVGTVEINKGIYSLKPLTVCCQFDPIIQPSKVKISKGQLVKAKIKANPRSGKPAIVKVIEVVKSKSKLLDQIKIICDALEIPNDYPDNLVPKRQPKYSKREDWRQLDFVTIDGDDAKDFDDAVYVEKHRDTYSVYVAIADVAHYVKPNSPLDKEAYLRGTSVYFPGYVIPMLPEQLSNDWCSLKPNEDRLALAVKMMMNRKGQILSSTIHEVVICSKHRLTYQKVQDYIEMRTPNEFSSILDPLIETYHLLQQQKQDRGALAFNRKTIVPLIDKHNEVKFRDDSQTDAHRLIEVLMLSANEEIAKFCIKHKLPALYRNHGSPDEQKWQHIVDFLKAYEIHAKPNHIPDPKEMSQLLQKVQTLDASEIIEQMLLRSLPQALYEDKNNGHFGLNYKEYLHFTSPIRRYPDLLVHRAIKDFINHAKSSSNDLKKVAQHCSYSERRAEQATRWVDSWIKCQFMSQKIGAVYTGRISNVLNFGLFVYIEELGIDGLIHVSNLPQDYYDYEESTQQLKGRYTHSIYSLGDLIKIKVDHVDLESRKVDFQLER
ncbi:MAG: ribonuclease R [Legionellales bacterium]|nr:ribonuclease R [Legionellales bacterium]|tara:strand:+ start:4860 stop:6935 length:2076 start_codon:yes stop_codon:yes gene_type:complete